MDRIYFIEYSNNINKYLFDLVLQWMVTTIHADKACAGIFGLDVGSVAGDSSSVLRALTRCGGVALAMWASLQKLEQRCNKTSATLRSELPRSFKFDNSLTFTEEEFFI